MNKREWMAKCIEWKNKWETIQPEHFEIPYSQDTRVSIYALIDALNRFSSKDDIFVFDAGSISYVGPVALKLKEGQRIISSPSQADMGWAIPASIGVAKASGKRVICITGDGSFMSNMQELATIQEHYLNIKIIVLNNEGYLSIKNTQEKYFGGRVWGTGRNRGLWFPSLYKVARTFELGYWEIRKTQELENLDRLILSSGLDNPVLVEVLCRENEEILPAQGLKNGKQAPLHDMVPFLSDEEMKKEMINVY
jgi:acetolactate synthase-1/2/3 large subunit